MSQTRCRPHRSEASTRPRRAYGGREDSRVSKTTERVETRTRIDCGCIGPGLPAAVGQPLREQRSVDGAETAIDVRNSVTSSAHGIGCNRRYAARIEPRGHERGRPRSCSCTRTDDVQCRESIFRSVASAETVRKAVGPAQMRRPSRGPPVLWSTFPSSMIPCVSLPMA